MAYGMLITLANLIMPLFQKVTKRFFQIDSHGAGLAEDWLARPSPVEIGLTIPLNRKILFASIDLLLQY